MRHLAPPRTAAALLVCCSLLVAAAAAVFGTGPRAHADPAEILGGLTLPVTSGAIADSPTFARVTADAACPTANAAQVSLNLRWDRSEPTGNLPLGKTAVGAPFDLGPFSTDIATGTSLQAQLRSRIPTGALDGTYEIRLYCRTAGNVGSLYFPAQIQVTGDSWALKAAAPTTTALTATPAATAPAGTEVKLTAAVTPAGAAGQVAFLDGTTELAKADAAAGAAELKTTALAVGAHTLTAKFIPADTGAYTESVSTAVAYTVTAASSSPPPTPSDSPTPTEPADLDVTDEDGTPLEINPTLTAGQKVLITARGYTKDAKVKVALADSGATFPDAAADAEGTVSAYAFTVPDGIEDGSYTLTLAEDKADGHSVEFLFGIGDAPGPDPDPSDSAGADDGGTTDGADSGGTDGSSTGGDGPGGGSATGPLASTGTSALVLGVAALSLCGLGTAFVMHARRRGLLRF